MATGEYLANYMRVQGIMLPRIVIKTSPFIRCVQTACGILEGLKSLRRQPIIEIDSHFCEFMSKSIFPKDHPLPLLEVSRFNLKDLWLKYKLPKAIAVTQNEDTYQEAIMGYYPEFKRRHMSRILKSLDWMINDHRV